MAALIRRRETTIDTHRNASVILAGMKRTTLPSLALAALAAVSSHTPARADAVHEGAALSTGEKIGKDCTRKGKKLFGKVKVVESFADLKVKVVQSSPDLKVKFVESFPDACGKWQMVESFPDLKIKFVESFPDLEIQMVESFPGVP